jgi:polar amino acid transport system substrate-binding protein
MMKIAGLLITFLVGWFSVASASAQTSVLDTIKQRKKVQIGVLYDAPPFGMLDSDMQPTGYDVDAARLLAKDLGVELELVQVTIPNRIPYLVSSRVDLVMASFSVTPERALSIDFSSPYGVLRQVIMGDKSLTINSMMDLVNRKVAVVRGALQDIMISRIAPPGTIIQRYDDDATAAAAVASGQADLAGMAEGTAKAVIEKSTSRALDTKFVYIESPFSIGLRKGDWPLLQWLNTWVYYHRRVDGAFDTLHQKYFGYPLPANVGSF